MAAIQFKNGLKCIQIKFNKKKKNYNYLRISLSLLTVEGLKLRIFNNKSCFSFCILRSSATKSSFDLLSFSPFALCDCRSDIFAARKSSKFLQLKNLIFLMRALDSAEATGRDDKYFLYAFSLVRSTPA